MLRHFNKYWLAPAAPPWAVQKWSWVLPSTHTPSQTRDHMLVEAIARARACAEAGADGLLAPGLADIALIARLVKASSLPVNIMIGNATPPVLALAEHGVARVSHGPLPYLVAMKALEDGTRGAAT